MGKKAGLEAGPGYPPQQMATHHHQSTQKLFLLHLNLIRQRLQDHFVHLTEVIQLILGASRRVLAASPASPLVQQGKARGSPTCWLSFSCCS